MSIFIQALTTGSEITANMQLGYALQKVRDVHGNMSSRVPAKAGVARSWDIANLAGLVLNNDTENCELRVQFGRYNHINLLVEQINGEYLIADVPYWAFKRIRLLSPINFEPHPPSQQFPTFNQFAQDQPKPYRTLTRVINPYATCSTNAIKVRQ